MSFLLRTIPSNVNTVGGGIWYEPYASGTGQQYYNPYVYVDDDADQLEAFKSIAARLGTGSLEVTQSGKEAEKLLKREESFDFFLVDWKMPEMNGLEFVRLLRSYGSESVVVMISAADLGRIKDEAREAGIDAFLEKPLSATNVARCINESMGKKAPLREEKDTKDELGCFAGKRILLVEDVEINREIVITLIEPTGIEVESAETGVETLEMYKKDPERYDLIFMDIHMPEMDGHEATRRTRSLPNKRARSMPIIAMTANVFREDIEYCLEVGMNDHIGKPVDMDTVMEKLRRYLIHKEP